MEQLDALDHAICVKDRLVAVQPVEPEHDMSVPERRELTGGTRPIQRVHPQGLQEPVELLPAGLLVHSHEVLVDQTTHRVEHSDRVQVAYRGRDDLRSLHREGAGEDTEPAEDHLLGLVQSVMTPANRRSQRLLPGQHRPRTAREEVEAIVELDGDLLGRHLPAAGRRQLQGERDAVEPMTDLGDGGCVGLRDHEGRAGPASPIDEQPDRLVLG
jgi:hypothetical protein